MNLGSGRKERGAKSPEIVFARSVDVAESYKRKGFTPVECCFGTDSVVDSLKMDHHGKYAALGPVCVRAVESYLGCRAKNPRFVVTGRPDQDVTLAIAALSGLLLDPECRSRQGRLLDLATMVAMRDDDPTFKISLDSPSAQMIAAWEIAMRRIRPFKKFGLGVRLWADIVTRLSYDKEWMNRAISDWQRSEKSRLRSLLRIPPEIIDEFSSFVVSPVWGFDQWYEKSWVVVRYLPRSGKVTIGVKTRAIARMLFGPNGLLVVLPLLEQGWGGVDTVIGSPRGVRQSVNKARRIAEMVARQVGQR